MRLPRYWLLPLVLGLVLAFGLAPAAAAGPPASQAPTQVRVVNALVGVPAVTVVVDGLPTEPPLLFGANAQYVELPPGPHTITLTVPTPLGAIPPPPLVGTDLMVAPGSAYTLFAMGAMGTPPIFLTLTDEPLGASGTRAGVRFVNASPDMQPVDLAIPGGPVLVGGIAFGEASPYVLLPAGTVALEARLAGSGTVVLDIPAVEIAPGRSYTFAAVGLAAGMPPLALVSMSDL
jgi:hypothetical protein